MLRVTHCRFSGLEAPTLLACRAKQRECGRHEAQPRGAGRLVDTGGAWQVAHSERTIAATGQWAEMLAGAGQDWEVLVVRTGLRDRRGVAQRWRTCFASPKDLCGAGSGPPEREPPSGEGTDGRRGARVDAHESRVGDVVQSLRHHPRIMADPGTAWRSALAGLLALTRRAARCPRLHPSRVPASR